MYVTVNKKVISVDEERDEEELKRIRYALRMAEKRLLEIERDKKRRGYCPDCHLLLAVNGRCSKCGFIWKFHRTQF